MITTTEVYKFITHIYDEITWDHDYINMHIVERALAGIFDFIGSGIVSGWTIEQATTNEIENLSSAIKQQLSHTNSDMIIKINAGDGIIGQYAAFTPEPVYIALPFRKENKIYYVYAVATERTAENFLANIIYSEDSQYDSNHNAVYLGTIVTSYNRNSGLETIYQIKNERRRELKNLEGPLLEAFKEYFLKHVHSGTRGSPSKINLSSREIIDITITPGSNIATFTPFLLRTDLSEETILSDRYNIYEKCDVLLNGELVAETDYSLENASGRIYFKNNFKENDKLRFILYLNPSQTQIARGPQDDPGATITSSELAVDNRYKLPAERVENLTGEHIARGRISPSRLASISHYGLKRLQEATIIKPTIETKTKDFLEYYFVWPEQKIQYSDKIYTTYYSRIAQAYFISTITGLYKLSSISDTRNAQKCLYNIDLGIVVKIMDNLTLGAHGGENRFSEIYLLNNRGEIWVSYDLGSRWSKIDIPSREELFVYDFTVSTDKVQREVKNRITYDYYKVFNLATNKGLYYAYFLAAKGNALGSSDLVDVPVIPWALNTTTDDITYTKIAEIITPHIIRTETYSSIGYDRTIYAAREMGGLYIFRSQGGARELVKNTSTMQLIDILWLHENNGLLLATEDKIYVSHSAKRIIEETAEKYEDYWKHPLTSPSDFPHLSEALTGKKIFTLSQHSESRIYYAGLDNGIAISSVDREYTAIPSFPYIDIYIDIDSANGISGITTSIDVTSNQTTSIVPLSVEVLDDSTIPDDELEQKDGWSPLQWQIKGENILYNTTNVLVDYNNIIGYDMESDEHTYVIQTGTEFGLWTSQNNGSSWERPYNYCNEQDSVSVYKNNTIVSAGNYYVDKTKQAVVFYTQQNASDIITIEKDFKRYYLINGKIEQKDADIIVFINGLVSNIHYIIDYDNGVIIFQESLSPSDVVTASIIKRGEYILDTGENPHEEILEEFVVDKDSYTKLTKDLTEIDRDIIIEDGRVFSDITFYIIIDSEKILVRKINNYKLRSVYPRFGSYHYKNTLVYKVDKTRLIGIENIMSKIISGQTEKTNFLTTNNLLRMHLELSEV